MTHELIQPIVFLRNWLHAVALRSDHTQPGEVVRRRQFERTLNFVRLSKDKV